MLKSDRTVRYTAKEIDEMLARGEDLTDWERVKALTDEEIEASIDFEEEGHFDLSKARMIYTPEAKKQITLRLDPDVIDFFKAGGPGYQTRMNAVLRQYVVANAK
jgi:uncharacterized protein (DUF4415 family)